jgi:outer membrane PBP1 activator LpoA protein
VKSIESVRRWLIPITALLLATSLVGCAGVKPITVQTQEVARQPLALELPAPVRITPVTWTLVTPANVDEVFAAMSERGDDAVLFTITADGYKDLAVTMGELRNLIATQRAIIVKYQQYYESKPAAKQ